MSEPGWAGIRYDALVIGAGLAGLTAAVRLAEAGARVVVLAKGMGGTHLGPGTIDVLGYDPERVERPAAALAQFAARHPGHPYGVLGVEAVAASIEWFKRRFEDGALGGYRYRGGIEENVLLPTAVGVAKPSAVVPETMAAGDVRSGGRLCIVGFRALRDLYPAYLADNLARAADGIRARAVVLDPRVEGRVEANTLAYARAFDDARFRAALADDLRGRLDGEERVGVPATLGLADPHAAWRDLEDRLGRPVFEIPTLPPSVPGIRVFRVLRDALRRARGRLIVGSEAVGAQAADGRVDAIRALASGRELTYRARWVVLASGGFASGGLELDSRWRARETVLDLPLANVPGTGEARFRSGYLDDQPLARVGVGVDRGLRPVGGDGARVYDNVLVTGATLAGAQPWREKSGDGLSLATGHRAAELILAEST